MADKTFAVDNTHRNHNHMGVPITVANLKSGLLAKTLDRVVYPWQGLIRDITGLPDALAHDEDEPTSNEEKILIPAPPYLVHATFAGPDGTLAGYLADTGQAFEVPYGTLTVTDHAVHGDTATSFATVNGALTGSAFFSVGAVGAANVGAGGSFLPIVTVGPAANFIATCWELSSSASGLTLTRSNGTVILAQSAGFPWVNGEQVTTTLSYDADSKVLTAFVNGAEVLSYDTSTDPTIAAEFATFDTPGFCTFNDEVPVTEFVVTGA